jgi:hypothetical protein
MKFKIAFLLAVFCVGILTAVTDSVVAQRWKRVEI